MKQEPDVNNAAKPKKQGILSRIFPDNRSFDSTLIALGLCYIFYVVVDKAMEVVSEDPTQFITVFQGVKELIQMVVVGLFTKKVMEDKNKSGETIT